MAKRKSPPVNSGYIPNFKSKATIRTLTVTMAAIVVYQLIVDPLIVTPIQNQARRANLPI
jgi:hypothetical protein